MEPLDVLQRATNRTGSKCHVSIFRPRERAKQRKSSTVCCYRGYPGLINTVHSLADIFLIIGLHSHLQSSLHRCLTEFLPRIRFDCTQHSTAGTFRTWLPAAKQLESNLALTKESWGWISESLTSLYVDPSYPLFSVSWYFPIRKG